MIPTISVGSGYIFEDIQLIIFPCKAVNDQAKVTELKLPHLPMFIKDEIIDRLKQNLAIFDDILDTGIFTEKAIDFFMGTDYAVRNTYQAPDAFNGKSSLF
jgi:hypothetical protein